MCETDLTCAAIRLAPVWICLAVHFVEGRWLTHPRPLLRVLRYGFSVHAFKKNPMVLLTHLFVHHSDAHLFGNMLFLTIALIEFDKSSIITNMNENNLFVALHRTLESFFVFIVGGIGGIGGQLLFTEIQCAHPHGVPLLRSELPSLLYDENNYNYNGGTGSDLFTSMLGGLSRWFDDIVYRVRKRRERHTLMCGASAGTCALAGFNSACHRRWALAVATLLPDVLALMCQLRETSSSSFMAVQWIQERNVIGHAAHIGGFVVGFGVGLLWRWSGRSIALTRRRRNERVANDR